MIDDLSKLRKGQRLKVEINQLKERVPKKLITKIEDDPYGILIGYKLVDGNQFALVIEFKDKSSSWFFDQELSEIEV